MLQLERMRIDNQIDNCSNGFAREIDLDARDTIVIHRTEVGHCAEEIAEAYRYSHLGKVTGYQMPYTFVIDHRGIVEQAMRLGDYTPHARRWSSRGIGIACTGDFRTAPPPPPQYAALEDLVLVLAARFGVKGIHGHTELSGATRDPNKDCPGRMLEIPRLRWDVTNRLNDHLRATGIVL